jgi:hypothetical protein
MNEPPFPPTCVQHIHDYDSDDVVMGYRAHRIEDTPPGHNYPPGYRWGFANARCDASRAPDGFEALRYAYIQWCREAAPSPAPRDEVGQQQQRSGLG